MNVHEYQGKEIFCASFGVATPPRALPCFFFSGLRRLPQPNQLGGQGSGVVKARFMPAAAANAAAFQKSGHSFCKKVHDLRFEDSLA